MKRLSILLLVAACGSSAPKTSSPADSDAKVVGPPEVAWKDMSHEQKARFMDKVVMPKFKPMFQEFDAKGFSEFNCATCHGVGAKDKSFKLPNKDIYWLPEAPEDFEKLGAAKPEWMKFMPKVEEEMAATLGMKPYDKAAPDPSQFGCYACHAHKPGGGDPK